MPRGVVRKGRVRRAVSWLGAVAMRWARRAARSPALPLSLQEALDAREPLGASSLELQRLQTRTRVTFRGGETICSGQRVLAGPRWDKHRARRIGS